MAYEKDGEILFITLSRTEWKVGHYSNIRLECLNSIMNLHVAEESSKSDPLQRTKSLNHICVSLTASWLIPNVLRRQEHTEHVPSEEHSGNGAFPI